MLLTSSWGHARESRVSAALGGDNPANPANPARGGGSKVLDCVWPTKNHFFHRTIAPVRQSGTKNTPFTEET